MVEKTQESESGMTVDGLRASDLLSAAHPGSGHEPASRQFEGDRRAPHGDEWMKEVPSLGIESADAGRAYRLHGTTGYDNQWFQ